MSRPKLILKLELTIPGDGENLPKKFSVNRALRARWSENPSTTTEEILREIRDYKGSFIGDVVDSLHNVTVSEDSLRTPGFDRSLEVSRWIVSILESMLLSDISDGRHDELLENNCIFELDGATKDIGGVLPSEVKDIDMERLMILLAPRIKNVVRLLGKKLPK